MEIISSDDKGKRKKTLDEFERQKRENYAFCNTQAEKLAQEVAEQIREAYLAGKPSVDVEIESNRFDYQLPNKSHQSWISVTDVLKEVFAKAVEGKVFVTHNPSEPDPGDKRWVKYTIFF